MFSVALASLAFVLALLVAPAAAQPKVSPWPFPDVRNQSKPVQGAMNVTTSFSSSGPITQFLTRNKPVSRTLPQLFRLITEVDAASTYEVAVTHNVSAPIHQLLRPDPDDLATVKSCHWVTDSWKGDVEVFHLARGLPMPDMQCVSIVRSKTFKLRDKKHDAFNAIRTHARDMQSVATRMVSQWRATDPALAARLVNWTVPNGRAPYATRPAGFRFNAHEQRCTYDHVAFVRDTSVWFVGVSLTNAPQTAVMRRGTREHIEEFVRLGGEPRPQGAPRAMLARQPGVDNGPTGPWVRGTTTVRLRDYGAATAATFARQDARDNLAVHEALRLGENAVQQGSDATTASNVAILAVPLVLSAVPVALITQVNTVGLLAYTLFTDVLVGVPLAIKGYELLQIGAQRSRAVLVRMSGGNLPGPDENTDAQGHFVRKAAEAWAAECRPAADLRGTGIALLSVAVVCMVGGIVAEIVALAYVRRRDKGSGQSSVGEQQSGQGQVGWLLVSGMKRRGTGNTSPPSSMNHTKIEF